MSGPFVSQSLLTFLFGQTWSEIKTLQNWRAVASTHPLMLFPTSPREALLACPPSLPWNPPSLTVESTLSSALFHSDSLLFRQGAALAHLDSLPPYDLWVWTDASVPFPFGKGGSSVLANCSLCGTETTLSFLAGPVSSSFFTCAILQVLRWSRQHQQVCHFSFFLLSDSRSALATLFFPPAGTVFSFFLYYQTTVDP